MTTDSQDIRRAYACLSTDSKSERQDHLSSIREPLNHSCKCCQPKLMRHVMRRQYDRVMDDYELTDSQAYLGEMP